MYVQSSSICSISQDKLYGAVTPGVNMLCINFCSFKEIPMASKGLKLHEEHKQILKANLSISELATHLFSEASLILGFNFLQGTLSNLLRRHRGICCCDRLQLNIKVYNRNQNVMFMPYANRLGLWVNNYYVHCSHWMFMCTDGTGHSHNPSSAISQAC